MATLYLHIGTPKTGTTAIQIFCEANKRALARRGYCFPIFPHKYEDARIQRNGRFLVYFEGADGGFERPCEERMWRRRMDYVEALFRKYPNVILSDEDIWRAARFKCPSLWERLKAEACARGFELRIVVYLRRQDQFLHSWWAQRVKTARGECGRMRWSEMLARADEWMELDYHAHLERIAACFGRDAIDVRVYDRARFAGGDVVMDFLGAIGLIPGDDFVHPSGEQNPSLGGSALEVCRILNGMPGISPFERSRLERRVAACGALAGGAADGAPLSLDELRAFLRKYEESNRLVARDYLGDVDGALFAPPHDSPGREEGARDGCEAVVRFFATELLARPGRRALLRAEEKLRPPLRVLKWKLKALPDYLLRR